MILGKPEICEIRAILAGIRIASNFSLIIMMNNDENTSIFLYRGIDKFELILTSNPIYLTLLRNIGN